MLVIDISWLPFPTATEAFLIQYFRCSEAGVGVEGGELDEAAFRFQEEFAREACRGFPSITYIKVKTKSLIH